MKVQIIKSASLRYFRLRPELTWSLTAFFILSAVLFTVSWTNCYDSDELMDMTDFRMVNIQTPETRAPSPDLALSDEKIPETVEKAEKPLQFGDDSSIPGDQSNISAPPVPRFRSLPSYPDSMRQAGIEGIVTIEVGIDCSGNIIYGRIVKSLGRAFDIVVINWARSIRFRPAKDNERNPIPCRLRIPVRFKLDV